MMSGRPFCVLATQASQWTAVIATATATAAVAATATATVQHQLPKAMLKSSANTAVALTTADSIIQIPDTLY